MKSCKRTRSVLEAAVVLTCKLYGYLHIERVLVQMIPLSIINEKAPKAKKGDLYWSATEQSSGVHVYSPTQAQIDSAVKQYGGGNYAFHIQVCPELPRITKYIQSE